MYSIGHKKNIVTEQFIGRHPDEIRKEDFHTSNRVKIYVKCTMFFIEGLFFIYADRRSYFLAIDNLLEKEPACSDLLPTARA